MLDSFGSALRVLRQQRGLSLRSLARKTSLSPGYLGNLESGQRPPTADTARVCDAALESGPLLRVLYEIERGDAMRRRILLGGSFAAAAGALLAGSDTTAALAAVLNSGLRASAGDSVNWDQLAADFSRRHLLAPSKQLGQELAAQIAVAQHYVAAGDKDAARGAALLALTYGLWLGDIDRIPNAHAFYDTSAALADRSTDSGTRALVRARAANRGLYEGWNAARALTAADEALAITAGGRAALEAHAARVHVAGLTGNNSAGRAAVQAMYDVADTLATTEERAGGYRRAVSFDCYLTCRTGDLADAERVYERARTELAAVPLWLADATIYMARAQVAAGDVTGGLRLALQAAKSTAAPVRVLGWGVRDVLSVVPTQRSRHAEVEALRPYAAHGPAPWDTV